MKVVVHSYRFAQQIIEHPSNAAAWNEILGVIKKAPLFVYPGKSEKQKNVDVVQQVMNTYFDRRLAIDLKWDYHPYATEIKDSNLRADYRKQFGQLTVQAEFQFGNMSRWYSDIFKFQTAYSTRLINVGLSVVPMSSLARRIDQNVVNYERTVRELPSAELSITLPIILAGLEPDKSTPVVDLRKCKFKSIKEITGKGNADNRWRIVHGYVSGKPMEEIDPDSEKGPSLPVDSAAEEVDS